MNKLIDLTSIHARLEPRPKATAMEESRRIERAETAMLCRILAGGTLGVVVVMVAFWLCTR